MKPHFKPFSIEDMVRESNRIENIHRDPTPEEIQAHISFMKLPKLEISDVEGFVRACQPDARLRIYPHLNVRVGEHYPPSGGQSILYKLADILNHAFRERQSPRAAWKVHCDYEKLHPFTDGNGRSGRVIWYWMMHDTGWDDYGFLRAFYYQTLDASRDFT